MVKRSQLVPAAAWTHVTDLAYKFFHTGCVGTTTSVTASMASDCLSGFQSHKQVATRAGQCVIDFDAMFHIYFIYIYIYIYISVDRIPSHAAP